MLLPILVLLLLFLGALLLLLVLVLLLFLSALLLLFALILLLLNIVGQLVMVFQTRYQLVSPFIPESAIWSICKQFVFNALIASIVGVIGLILDFFEKHLLVIILVVLTLIAVRFIYI